MAALKDDIIAKVEKLLEKHPICDHCLGRQFAWLSTNTTNVQRGFSLKLSLSMSADEQLKHNDRESGRESLLLLASKGMFEPARQLCKKNGFEFEEDYICHLCTLHEEGIFERIPGIVKRVLDIAPSVEFTTFLVGTSPDPELVEKHDELRANFELLDAETLKSDFNRELGKELAKALDKDVNFERPDLVIFYDMVKDHVEFRVNPIFIFGRYRKLERGIPQSKWDCGECNGRGCDSCKGTGRKYQDSVSEYIGIPAKDLLKGSKFKVHAAGREDIDVLMLGNGRPFVIEISKPTVRDPDLYALTNLINEQSMGKVEVTDLKISTRKRFQQLKSEASENVKEYQAIIQTNEAPKEKELKKAEKLLIGATIEQRTPNRVAHRRSDLVRKKQVLDVKLQKVDSGKIEGFFRVQGGTYVKELISGDEGRTSPSLSEALDTPCICIQLDVVGIHSRQTDHNL
ncbi:MAG: tRNA pseudouridine(54/55) synthase Pus10 [Candidatus Thorarchaeota archaeon]